MLGAPVDVGAVTPDAYVVAGVNDHIVPWENAYRSASLLGGDARFVLSSSGHIQALVNPPSAESRARYRTAAGRPAEPGEWVDAATTHRGSWTAWLGERSGALKPAPAKLGSRKHKAAGTAPGSYVHAT